MRHVVRFAAVVSMILCSSSFSLAVPQLINFQGTLTDPGTGDPIMGNTPVVLRLYEGGTNMAGGTIVYTENATLTTDDRGFFNHLIGSQATNADAAHTLSASDFVTNNTVWLEIDISGTPLLPRSQLVTVSYAMSVATLDASEGGEISGDVSISGGNLSLDQSTASAGNIYKNGQLFMHDAGDNTFIGWNSGNLTMTGLRNTGCGYLAMSQNTTGDGNTAIGDHALSLNTTGFWNTAIGESALNFNTTGKRNVACGHYSMLNNTDGLGNTAVGNSSLFSNTVGFDNVAIGESALHDNIDANENTAVGHSALSNSIDGGQNVAIGASSLISNTSGTNNSACGYSPLYSNTIGHNNVANGRSALFANTEGSFNTGIGSHSLLSNTTGNDNTALGYSADVSSGDLTNATAIGNSAKVDASNKIRLGNTLVSVIEGQVAYTFTSDKNEKENFRAVDADAVLRKLCEIDVSSWNYIGQDAATFRHYGPVAQDFFAAFGHDEVGSIGSPVTINSGDMAGILMLAVQAVEDRNRELESEVAELRDLVEVLRKGK